MAMAAATLVGMPSAGAILSTSSGPVAGNLSGTMRSRIEPGSRGILQLRCSASDFSARAPESGSGRDGGACGACGGSAAAASCFGGISGSIVMNSPNARFGWSASGLLKSDAIRRLAVMRNRIVPRRSVLRIAAERTDLTNVAGTLLRLGKQGLDAGAKFVPESVPRPVAQAGVGFAGVVVGSFLLRSLFSTVTFVLAIGALSYAAYFFLTKGESSTGVDRDSRGSSGKPKSSDDALEEARRIMDKYK